MTTDTKRLAPGQQGEPQKLDPQTQQIDSPDENTRPEGQQGRNYDPAEWVEALGWFVPMYREARLSSDPVSALIALKKHPRTKKYHAEFVKFVEAREADRDRVLDTLAQLPDAKLQNYFRNVREMAAAEAALEALRVVITLSAEGPLQ